MILSAIRAIYFIYVLIIVCRNSAKPFCKRPAFMNWLPTLILISSVCSMCIGAIIIRDTVIGNGQVVCELFRYDIYFTIVA